MPQSPKNLGGNAQIKKQGHTASDRYGDSPDVKAKGDKPPRDLGIKAK